MVMPGGQLELHGEPRSQSWLQLDMTADEHEWIVDFVREAPCQFDEVFGAGFRCGLDGCGEGRVQLVDHALAPGFRMIGKVAVVHKVGAT